MASHHHLGTENETPWVEMAVRKTAQPSEPKKASANTPSARRGDPSRETGRANDTARYNGAQNEDSYEAALRAADALFSAAPVHRSINETSTPVADAIFAPKPDDAAGTAAAGSGRILRVVDEEEAPEHGALEAERTPKRRGRKPGSKNKPKIVVTNEDATFALPNRHAKADWTTLFDDEDETDEDETITPSTPLLPHRAFVVPSLRLRGEGRFAWVRTKLGPGESWKKRLPKILW